MIKLLLVLCLIGPVWIEGRTKINGQFGPAGMIGALYVQHGRTFLPQMDLPAFMLAGSWINIRCPAGLNTDCVWRKNGAIEIVDNKQSSLPISVKLTVFDGTINLSSIEGLTFIEGTGIENQNMYFYGTIQDVNTALAAIKYNPPTEDHTNRKITGVLSVDFDYYTTEYINQPPIIHILN